LKCGAYGASAMAYHGNTKTAVCVSSCTQIPACSSIVCNYVAYYPQLPPPGSYENVATVGYSVDGSPGIGSAQGNAIFLVGTPSVTAGSLQTTAGQIPAGSALVTDVLSPQGSYLFGGTGQQSYITRLTCPDSQVITNQATLTASTGQQINSAATVQKLCYELQVSGVSLVCNLYIFSNETEVTSSALLNL
jgi:hypothetical protein